ncbi:UDP-N-acetylglucosamine transporter TMEM241 isoform X2 [Ranitomeya imitator]|uniref:UDP-N-acetylglucosamine transporter TMEM241 isoform X2 n=2 Tax=Ranitomeya imitator TaxID=111125 RepID=UPI0037E88257
MYSRGPAVGLTYCAFYLAFYLTNKVADVSGWHPSSHMLEAGLGGDQLQFQPIPIFLTLHNASDVVSYVVQKIFFREPSSYIRLCSVTLLLISAGSLPIHDKQALGWIVNFKKSRLHPETHQSFLGLSLDSLRGSHIKILSDNTTVVAYLNHQAGTRSKSLMSSAASIFDLAELNFLSLTALHIRGIENTKADFLSRHMLRQGEWTLNPQIFKNIVDMWGLPQIDLFATRNNRQVRAFASLNVADKPDLIDSLQYPWNYNLAYAFPPMMLIPLVIKKIREEKARVILIAPFWPKRPWFSCLQAMSVCDPWILPMTPDLLSQGPFYHPQVKGLHLTAWNLRGKY